jgi:hypothetical protein
VTDQPSHDAHRIMKATIDQLEDSEYISDVNKRLGIRYNNHPRINLTRERRCFSGNKV